MVRISRRSIIATFGCSLLIAAPGCLGPGPLGRGDPFDPHDHVEDWQDDHVRGTADPINIEQTVGSDHSLESECGWVSRDAVEAAITESVTITRAVEIDYTKREGLNGGDWFVMVSRSIHFDQPNEVHLTPEISFDALRDAAPHAVRADITRGDEEYSCCHPVYVVDVAVQVAP